MPEDFLVYTKAAVNKIAQEYDAKNDENEIIFWMRNIVHDIYLQYFVAGSNLLELNCGTAEDSLFLAQKGMNMYATDLSPAMINIARNKIKKLDLENKVEAHALSFDEIDKAGKDNFDGAVSNFGGLNCTRNYQNLEKALSEKIKPGGKFIAVVMNKFCPWEIFYYVTRLDFKNAFRRFKKNGIDADLNGEKVKTFYYFPKEFGKHFIKNFKIEKIYTLGYFTPSPYLIGIYRRFKPLVKLCMKLDETIKGLYPFSRIGDHFIIIMKRNG
jgi:ubiquinone/menaquinone biosynthesis C-methylase UbiE